MNRLIYAFVVAALLAMSNAKAQEDDYSRYLRTGQLLPHQPPQPTFDQLSANLATYRGRLLNNAINNFGYPDTQQVIAGHNLYIWVVNQTQGFLNPDGGGSINLSAHCKLTMEVDAQMTVTNVVYDGNMPGCGRFMKAAVESPTPAPQPPTFADLVMQKQAANNNVPLTGKQLDDLKDEVWSREESGMWAQHNTTKESVQADKVTFESRYAKWKAGYLMQHPASVSSTRLQDSP